MATRHYALPVEATKWLVNGQSETICNMGVISYADTEPAEMFANDERIAEELEVALGATRAGAAAPASRAGDIAGTIAAAES